MSNRSPERVITILALGLVALVPAASVAAEERATPEEARELVSRAIALYDEAGRDAAFATFEDPESDFVDGDLYVFVFGPDRTIVAHGGDPELVGTSAAELEDVDGVPFGDLFMDRATEDGIWIGYKWEDPVTGEVLPKRSWVVLHDDHVFGAGIYEPRGE